MAATHEKKPRRGSIGARPKPTPPAQSPREGKSAPGCLARSAKKERESFAPRPSSPPSSCRTFPSRLRANHRASKLGKRGKYRAACLQLQKSPSGVAKRTRSARATGCDEQKNRHLTGGLGASERFCACVGREADAMTGDISARRGALPIKNQRRLTTLKWLIAFNYSRGREPQLGPSNVPGRVYP